MKQIQAICMGVLLAWGLALSPRPATAQLLVLDVIRAGVTKAIKAMDLKIQRLQNETIRLQNTQKALENELSRQKLEEIRGWAERQRAQYDAYFQELLEVKASLSSLGRLRETLGQFGSLVESHRRAWSLLRQHPAFSEGERRYMEATYAAQLRECARQAQELLFVVKSGTTSMGDGDRLGLLHTSADRLEASVLRLRRFHRQNLMLALRRTQGQREALALRRLLGLPSP